LLTFDFAKLIRTQITGSGLVRVLHVYGFGSVQILHATDIISSSSIHFFPLHGFQVGSFGSGLVLFQCLLSTRSLTP